MTKKMTDLKKVVKEPMKSFLNLYSNKKEMKIIKEKIFSNSSKMLENEVRTIQGGSINGEWLTVFTLKGDTFYGKFMSFNDVDSKQINFKYNFEDNVMIGIEGKQLEKTFIYVSSKLNKDVYSEEIFNYLLNNRGNFENVVRNYNQIENILRENVAITKNLNFEEEVVKKWANCLLFLFVVHFLWSGFNIILFMRDLSQNFYIKIIILFN